jgi:hypothetical protein
MNTTNDILLARPQHVTSLATSAILVNVEMRGTTLSLADEHVSQEVTDSKHAEKDAGSWTHKLIGKNVEHRRVMSYRSTLANFMKQYAYEWGGSWFLLPSGRLPTFMDEYAKHEAKFAELVEDFLAVYPNVVSDMAYKRGDLFNRNDYPTVDELRRRFGLKLYQSPVPTNDFRVAVSSALADDLHQHYERQTHDIVNSVGQRQVEQLRDYLTRLSHSCTVENTVDENGKVKTSRNRLVTKTLEDALELCNSVGEFNPSANAQLDDARLQLTRLLTSVDLNALKESDSLRSTVKVEIDSILSKFR